MTQSVGATMAPASHNPHLSSMMLLPIEKSALLFLLPLSEDYPDIERWYLRKVIPGVREGTRKLLPIERDGDLVGLGIAKNEPDEKKICTVRVAPLYVGRGLGFRIFDGLLRWLDFDKPHLTVSENKLPAFERVFDYYKFNITSISHGLYVPHSSELGYNEHSTLSSTIEIRSALSESFVGEPQLLNPTRTCR